MVVVIFWLAAGAAKPAPARPAPAPVLSDPLPAVMTREPDPPSKLEQKAAPVAVSLLPEDTGSVRVRVRRLA